MLIDFDSCQVLLSSVLTVARSFKHGLTRGQGCDEILLLFDLNLGKCLYIRTSKCLDSFFYINFPFGFGGGGFDIKACWVEAVAVIYHFYNFLPSWIEQLPEKAPRTKELVFSGEHLVYRGGWRESFSQGGPRGYFIISSAQVSWWISRRLCNQNLTVFNYAYSML